MSAQVISLPGHRVAMEAIAMMAKREAPTVVRHQWNVRSLAMILACMQASGRPRRQLEALIEAAAAPEIDILADDDVAYLRSRFGLGDA